MGAEPLHNRHSVRVARLILIGYWRSERTPEWPDPSTFVDEGWDDRERELVLDYLDEGLVPWASPGLSPCRLCGKPNGSAERTDGVYVWPEGLARYVATMQCVCPTKSWITS